VGEKRGKRLRCPAITASTNISTPGSPPRASVTTRKDRSEAKKATSFAMNDLSQFYNLKRALDQCRDPSESVHTG
jgi:hypothetical protein